MKKSFLFLPALALGGAFLILSPPPRGSAFSTLGGSLSAGGQRDFRVFNNFADAVTNSNTNNPANFPFWDGAEQALWKAASEWASRFHADGTGDPTQLLGNGEANFDFVFSGSATSAGGINRNIISAVPSCGGGTLAYVISPISNGWTMKFCDDFVWDDGPGGPPGGRIDLQGVGTHEFGHSLGLGHSTAPGATMRASTFNGFEQRSINSDDQAGVQFIYGAKSSSKPEITSVNVDLPNAMLTIFGTDFAASDNEIWFTNANATTPGTEPKVIVAGVDSTAGGTRIDVAIPPVAAPGDVHVKIPGSAHSTLSNAWPVDLDPSGGPVLEITGFSPSTVESLIPGLDETVTINGTGFTSSTAVTVDGLPPTSSTFVDANTITLDMPQVSSLGDIPVTVDDGVNSDTANITVVAPATPVLQIGNGEEASSNQITTPGPVDEIVAGPPGETHFVFISSSNTPSTISIVSLCLGNNFQELFEFDTAVVGAAGYTERTININSVFILTAYWQSLTLEQGTPIPTSNCQEAFLTF